jgi:hypothetical protein
MAISADCIYIFCALSVDLNNLKFVSFQVCTAVPPKWWSSIGVLQHTVFWFVCFDILEEYTASVFRVPPPEPIQLPQDGSSTFLQHIRTKQSKQCKSPIYDHVFINFQSLRSSCICHRHVTDYEAQYVQFSVHFTETIHMTAQSLNPSHKKRSIWNSNQRNEKNWLLYLVLKNKKFIQENT